MRNETLSSIFGCPIADAPAIKVDAQGAKHVIEFDGGTSCNIPAKGFGHGYGSYRIDALPIVRVKFGPGKSCNAAEILTLAAALNGLAKISDPSNAVVLVRGDSKIALKWAKHKGEPKANTSAGFRESILELRRIAAKFHTLRTEWRTRNVSVAIFGH